MRAVNLVHAAYVRKLPLPSPDVLSAEPSGDAAGRPTKRRKKGVAEPPALEQPPAGIAAEQSHPGVPVTFDVFKARVQCTLQMHNAYAFCTDW